jgi:RNA polymerase sigma-70 factor (ECF subfamily)
VASTTAAHEVTELLHALSRGDPNAMGRLIPLVYDQLHRVAAMRFARERGNHTLQPTALVHEAYLRLADQRRVRWQNRAHFVGVAAHLMRRILIDHARSHRAAKRGGRSDTFTLANPIDELRAAQTQSEPAEIDVLALDDALARLTALDAQQGRIVELRFFGGLTVEETAEVLGISAATVKRDWRLAKAWLHRELDGERS